MHLQACHQPFALLSGKTTPCPFVTVQSTNSLQGISADQYMYTYLQIRSKYWVLIRGQFQQNGSSDGYRAFMLQVQPHKRQ